MEKNIKKPRKSSMSVYLREDAIQAIDKWLEIKSTEGGTKIARYTRNSFIENAVMAKVNEYGLMDDDAT